MNEVAKAEMDLFQQLLTVFETHQAENCELYKTAILFIVGWTNDMLLYYLVCGREGVRGLPLGGMWGASGDETPRGGLCQASRRTTRYAVKVYCSPSPRRV